jgi:hypothetical protein
MQRLGIIELTRQRVIRREVRLHGGVLPAYQSRPIRFVPEARLGNIDFQLLKPQPILVNLQIGPRIINPLPQSRQVIREVTHRRPRA